MPPMKCFLMSYEIAQISSTNSQGLDEKQVPFLGVEVNIIGLKGL